MYAKSSIRCCALKEKKTFCGLIFWPCLWVHIQSNGTEREIGRRTTINYYKIEISLLRRYVAKMEFKMMLNVARSIDNKVTINYSKPNQAEYVLACKKEI